MKAEDKLAEACYFLEKLQNISKTMDSDRTPAQNLEEEFRFNLSAFVQAWRSVFDVLLYDYAEMYFKYGPERNIKINKDKFENIVEVLENLGDSRSREFIDWYKEKEKKLGKEHLWHLRVFFVHRGGKTLEPRLRERHVLKKDPLEVYVPPSAVSAGTAAPEVIYSFGKNIQVETEKELAIAGMPQTVILGECERVCHLMREIIEEARGLFK